MADFYISKKQVPSSADRAGSGVSQRMAEGAGRSSAKSSKSAVTKTGRGHFGATMLRLAKLRQPSRSKAFLQQGNVLTKRAPQGGAAPFTSGVDTPEGQGRKVQSTEGQTALNQKQQGASNKNAQRGKKSGDN